MCVCEIKQRGVCVLCVHACALMCVHVCACVRVCMHEPPTNVRAAVCVRA